MAYTLPQISDILLKSDRTMYRLGSIAYENMFSEDSEDVDYERDIIYIYKVAVEYADNFYVGTDKLDTVVEKLAAKIAVYDFGQLTPIYSDATIVTQSVPVGAALDDLSDVTITNVQNNQTLRYSSSLGQWINVGPGAAVRNRQQFTATLNQTVFVTTFPFESGLLDVYLNGVKLSPPSYTTFGNYTITLADGSLVDDIVEVIAYDPATSFIDLSGYVPTSRTLTINGVTYDLSANRTWTIDALPSQAGNTGKYLTTDGVVASWGAINLSGYVPYTGATANVDLGGFSIKPSMVQITGINSGGTGGVLNIKKGNTRVIGGDDAANNISLWAETAAFGFNDWVSGNLRNAKFSLLSITNNATRTYTLPNLDGTLALLSDITPGLTSVGLSMPSAFAVSNSPLTSNGTIAVTGAGTASQYIRGDGQLATLPSGSSGGSSVAYYLNGSVAASVAGYQQMANSAVIGAGTDFALVGNGLIAQFLTDVANPNRLEIPAGAWNFEMYFSASSSGGTPAFYVELLKYDGTTFTSIASSSAVPEAITSGTIIDLYLTSLAIPQTTLLSTDRLAIRVYIVNSTGGRTITMHTENSHLCEIITNFAGGLSALNGLTANTQYFATGTSGTDFAITSATDTHTFNLPTASATNRGALSSADWSTFSGKVGGSGATGQVAYWNGTNSQTGDNNLVWNSASIRLGIGRTPSARRLEIQVGSGGIASALGMFDGGGSLNSIIGIDTPTTTDLQIATVQGIRFYTGSTLGNIVTMPTNERMRLFSTGNLLLQNGGTFTDAGFRLDVNGTARVTGVVENQNGLAISGNPTFRVSNETFLIQSVFSSHSYIQSYNTSTALYKTLNILGDPIRFGNSNGTVLTVENSGSLNMRTTLSAWSSDFRVIQMQGGASFASFTSQPSAQVYTNLFYNGTNYVRISTGFGTRYSQYLGEHVFETTGSGSAGSTATMTTAMKLTAAGNLLVGTTTDAGYKLDVNGSAALRASGSFNLYVADNTNWSYIQNSGASSGTTNLGFFVSGATADLFISPAGRVGIGTASPSGKLHIRTDTDANVIFTGEFQYSLNNLGNAYTNYTLSTLQSVFSTNGAERMRITSATGNLLVGTTTDSGEKFQVNGTARVGGSSASAQLYLKGGLGAGQYLYLDNGGSDLWTIVGANVFIIDSSTTRILRANANAQVTINGNTNLATAQLQVDSTTRGFLPPRMTNAQRTAISSPAVGLLVYQTDSTEGTYEYISSGWRIINGGGGSVDELQVALISQVFG